MTCGAFMASSRCQFHQLFFARFFCTNVLFGTFSSYVLALAPKFRTKNARVNVDEIDDRYHFHSFCQKAGLFLQIQIVSIIHLQNGPGFLTQSGLWYWSPSLLGYLAIKINTMNPELINVYPNYLFVYALHFGYTFCGDSYKNLNCFTKVKILKKRSSFSKHDVIEIRF